MPNPPPPPWTHLDPPGPPYVALSRVMLFDRPTFLRKQARAASICATARVFGLRGPVLNLVN